jgi:streptogramin lyase
MDELGALAIDSAPFPDWVTVTEEGAWVANVGPGLTRYDRDGNVTAEVPTDAVIQAMQVGFGRLWLTSSPDGGGDATVLGVSTSDPADVVRIPLPGMTVPEESSVAVTDDAVWVVADPADTGLVLVRIDPAANAVVGTVPAPPGAGAMRGLAGSLWVSVPVSGHVARVDPADGTVLAEVDAGPMPNFLFPGAGAMWVLNAGDGSVTRIDPADNSGETVPASDLSVNGGDIVAGDDAVWVRSSAELAVRLDPETLDIVQRVGPPSGSGSIGIDGSGVWISAHDVKTVWFVADAG